MSGLPHSVSDAEQQGHKRKAVTGDPEAETRVRMGRCRSNECCGHAATPINQPTGCSVCPFLGWNQRDKHHICNLAPTVVDIPLDGNVEVQNAVPVTCPLWVGGILVDLKQLVGLR